MSASTPEIPAYGGCLWPMDPACRTDEWDAMDPGVQERSLALASSTLERLSGYRVGNCPITVRPVSDSGSCAIWSDARGWDLLRIHPLASAGGRRSQATPGRVALPGPVGRIEQVKVDGVVIDPVNYHIDGRELVWHGAGPNPFPTSQDLSRLDTEPNTFSVTYLNAYPVDSLGAYAVGVLALEFAKACTDGKKCRLPTGVTSIVRQGVSMEITSGAFPGGMTGIREVDSWIALWNPNGLRQAVKVYSPDIARTVTNPTIRPTPVVPLDGGSF